MAWSLLVLYGVIILIVFLVLKVVMKKQAIATRLAFFLFLFIIVTVGYVYMSSDMEIRNVKDVFNFGGVYFSWMGSVFSNFKTITADVVQEDWSINNSQTSG